MRAPGMTFWRMPLLVWANLATSTLVVLGTPFIAGSQFMVLYDRVTITKMLEKCGYEVIGLRPLVNQWMLGFDIMVALGFRNMGRLRLWEMLLGVGLTLPFIYLPWIFPEFMRVYARAVD